MMKYSKITVCQEKKQRRHIKKRIQSIHLPLWFLHVHKLQIIFQLQFKNPSLVKFFLIIFSRLNGISEVEKEVDFLLWTKDNPTEPDKLKIGDVFSLHLSHFKSDLPTKILIHGFEDTGKVIYSKYSKQ